LHLLLKINSYLFSGILLYELSFNRQQWSRQLFFAVPKSFAMKTNLFLLGCIVLFTNAHAQPAWLRASSFGGTLNDGGRSVSAGSDGSTYTAGMFTGTADFYLGPGSHTMTTPNFNSDIYVCKYDSAGLLIWARQMSGVSSEGAYEMAADASGNVYLTGFFYQSVDFDPGPGSFILTATFRDAFVCKLDSEGILLWAKQFGGAGTAALSGYAIAVDQAAPGNIYFGGTFTRTADFDPGPGVDSITATGVYDFFLCKLDSAGNHVWAHGIGGNGNDEESVSSIALDTAGRYLYATGYFSGTVDFDPGPTVDTVTATGWMDGWRRLSFSGPMEVFVFVPCFPNKGEFQ
jgi:hypothetical protein